MTKEEKAKELFNKYYSYKAKELFNKYYSYLKANLMNDEEAREDAKVCALIAVDEILDLNLKLSNCDENNWNIDKFYLEVKQEIKKL
jgi:hypothetical protein